MFNEEVKNAVEKSSCICFSYDTTGSMRSAIGHVRQNLKSLAETMFKDMPSLKMAFVGHGDYCDGDRCITMLDFTNDLDKIMSFIQDTPDTSGGDQPECYELVLNRVQQLSWPEEGGTLVMIGDADPHDVNYPENTDHLDWRKELATLKSKKINVFALQCLQRLNGTKFWSEMAELSGTPLLILEDAADFQNATDLLGGLAYTAGGSVADTDEYVGGAVLRTCGLSANATENYRKLASYKRTTETTGDSTK